MKSGLKSLALASTFGLGLALISGCNTEEAPPESTPPPAATAPGAGPAADAPKASEAKEAAPAPAPAPEAAPAGGEPKKAD